MASICFLDASAQTKNFHASVEVQGIYTSHGQIPFWMRSNQHGSIPLSGASASAIVSAYKNYDSNKKKLVDWGFGFESRANVGNNAQLILIEGYAKLKLGNFEFKAGRTKDIMGLVDTSLSSGAFSISGNALGIPKIEIRIPEYTNLFGGNLFAFKGNFAYGWVGDVPIQYGWNAPNTYPHPTHATTYFHQKSVYIKFGRPAWKVKLYGGLNHQVYWGSERSIFGPDWTLSEAKAFLYVVVAKAYGNNTALNSKVGNHLGSFDLGFQYDFENVRLFIYRQNIYDAVALWHFANETDGLNGISIQNKHSSKNKVQWKKILFEILDTKNQNGGLNSGYLPSGDENYYNHAGTYAQGWSYKGLALGNPFLSTRTTVRSNFPSNYFEYFINNRVLAFHTGIEGNINNWNYIAKLSYSKNYGTWATSPIGKRALNRRDPPNPFAFREADQFSTYFEATRMLKNGLRIGAVAAFDSGNLLYNSSGFILKLSKSF